ncbi:hypothetical protein Tco_1034455 [Tanacetum coccineum]
MVTYPKKHAKHRHFPYDESKSSNEVGGQGYYRQAAYYALGNRWWKKKKSEVLCPSELASPKIKGSLNADEDIGVDEKSVKEVVGGGEALGIGEDDDSCNATSNGGDDAVESGDISILISFIGYKSLRSPQMWGMIGTTDVQALIDKWVDKEIQYYVYILHVLIPFLNSLNDKYIKK